ncbi:MAG: amino acid ABC transporter permease [Rhodovibrionaceae bacterium]
MADTTQDSSSAKVALWNDPRYRALFFQLLLVAVVVWLFWALIDNTVTNLQRQNIASGFGFLDTTAGFGIITTLIPYSETSSYGQAFLVGLFNTILVAFIGIVLATILGFIVGIARLAPNWVIRKMAMVFVETMRNIPLLLQIFFWYFAVLRSVPGPRDSLVIMESFFLNNRGLIMPRALFAEGSNVVVIALLIGIVAAYFVRKWARKRQMATGQQFPVFLTALGLILGLPLISFLVMGAPISWEYAELKGFSFVGGLHIIPEFIALLFALSIYTAAFIAEIVRAGILAVSHGQTEAAYSLGFRPNYTLRLIIIPQALRVIIPPLTSQYLNLTKNSSLAVAIAYPDLVSIFAGTVLNQTGQAVEVLLMTMAVYLTLSILTSIFMNWYNARKALVER